MNSIDSTDFLPGYSNRQETSNSKLKKLIFSIKQFATIAEVMRILGAITMIASMSLLLLNGWHNGDDILRYLKLLGLTGLLAVGGFSLSYLLKERKGARLFFSLGLISVPANFGIIGALIYSLAPDIGLVSQYPDFARWVVSDVSSVVMVGAGALCILLPVTMLGFRILTKDSARLLTLTYLGLNALLLVPFRDPMLVGIMLTAALIVPTLVIRSRLSRDISLFSARGKYALSILFIPALLLLTRNLYLYQLDYILGMVFCATIYWICRQWSHSDTLGQLARTILDILSAPLAFGAAFCLAFQLDNNAFSLLTVGSFATVIVAYMLDFQHWAKQSLTKLVILVITSLVIMAATLMTALLMDTGGAAIMASLFGLALMAFGVCYRNRIVVIIGLALTLAAIWFGFNDIISLLIRGDWLALAILGAVTIVGASLVDRFGPVIKYRLSSRLENQESAFDTDKS